MKTIKIETETGIVVLQSLTELEGIRTMYVTKVLSNVSQCLYAAELMYSGLDYDTESELGEY